MPPSKRKGSSASILPKHRQLNGAFAAYLTRRWVPKAIRFYAWAVHSKAFHIGLAAGAVPLASRLPFGQAEAVETAAHAAPTAPIVPKRFKAFGDVRIDNYDWLRDRRDPRVVAYLDAENAYANARLEPIRPLIDELAAELKAREAQEDASVPTAYNGYLYERRFSQGAQYPFVVRRKDEHGAQDEIVLNVGELAAGHQQYQLGSWNVSPNNEHVAFSVDFTGGREFRIFVRTIATGETVDQGIDNASSDLVFGADSDTLFYVRNEPTTCTPIRLASSARQQPEQ